MVDIKQEKVSKVENIWNVKLYYLGKMKENILSCTNFAQRELYLKL